MRKIINKNRVVIAAAAMGLMGASSAFAADTATSSATAHVATPIKITQNTALGFGDLAATATAGTVTVAPAGTRSGDGNVVLMSGDAGAAGNYTVAGDAGATYAVTVPTTAVTLTHSTDTTKTMSLDTFKYNTSGGAGTAGTLNTSGQDTLTVGGTLHVGASQTAGDYSGNYNVTVDYN